MNQYVFCSHLVLTVLMHVHVFCVGLPDMTDNQSYSGGLRPYDAPSSQGICLFKM